MLNIIKKFFRDTEREKEIINYVIDKLLAPDGPVLQFPNSLEYSPRRHIIKNNMFEKTCRFFNIKYSIEN